MYTHGSNGRAVFLITEQCSDVFPCIGRVFVALSFAAGVQSPRLIGRGHERTFAVHERVDYSLRSYFIRIVSHPIDYSLGVLILLPTHQPRVSRTEYRCLAGWQVK